MHAQTKIDIYSGVFEFPSASFPRKTEYDIGFRWSWPLSFSTPKCHKSPNRLRGKIIIQCCGHFFQTYKHTVDFDYVDLGSTFTKINFCCFTCAKTFLILIFLLKWNLKDAHEFKGRTGNFLKCFSAFRCVLQPWWPAGDMPRCTRLLFSVVWPDSCQWSKK